MECIIKKYEEKDGEQLPQLLQLCSEDIDLIIIINSSRLICAYSAFYENKMVGILVAWTSSFHPNCTYFRIVSNPIYGQANVEKALLNKMLEQEELKLPLQTSIWETSVHLKTFYEENGFREIRRTYMPVLNVSLVKNDIPLLNENFKILPLKDVLLNGELLINLIKLVKRNYERTHEVNPVVEASTNKWKEMILSEDLLLSGSYLLLNNDSKDILAYSFLHESDNKETYELGWCGASEDNNKELICELILHQIKYSSEQGIQYILGEFDTTDDHAMEVLKSFPFQPSPTFITYQKR